MRVEINISSRASVYQTLTELIFFDVPAEHTDRSHIVTRDRFIKAGNFTAKEDRSPCVIVYKNYDALSPYRLCVNMRRSRCLYKVEFKVNDANERRLRPFLRVYARTLVRLTILSPANALTSGSHLCIHAHACKQQDKRNTYISISV